MKSFGALFILAILILAGCSTEVELNAPYLKTTVVMGLIDPVADTQWVKINKTFLGDGNNMDYTTIRDSSEYPEGSFVATIQQINDGDVVNTYNNKHSAKYNERTVRPVESMMWKNKF